MSLVCNAAAYKFTPIADPERLQSAVRHEAGQRQLKGTCLVAPEGINLFLAGAAADVRGFLDWLRGDQRFADLAAKESWSPRQPFGKLLVKLKREIIRMDHPAIQPAAGRAPAVDSATVRRWLDQGHDDAGRPVVTLDTRNAFEVDHGTFEGAVDWRITKFTEFPQAFLEHRAELEGKTVVSFCTGGIRCEKAALFMREAGHEHVYQLDGGILKYFEDTGGAHYRGACFVFDEREALAPDLSATKK
ncbi:sulfurtransferase [Variovorax terrae]|uniref:Sulfurtransferase n=1 Tax=Variovorax terrae TaxID=2923278 RepID=A0A9X1VS47_9BURK|nr:sulfurtransferase [Variovorax terrae]MCJ0762791.1 sulfurtransferase [Variovorax terrae]